MASSADQTCDFAHRFDELKALDGQRESLTIELLKHLDIVEAERDLLRSDLTIEQDARRRLQQEVAALQKVEKARCQSRFILVLLDADADIYLFHEKFITRQELGGQDAADQLMSMVREYVAPLIEGSETVNVMVKAFANTYGLSQACVKNGKLKSTSELGLFVAGFNRRYPLFDFIDVGSGKEEADNKIRAVLNLAVADLQCEHILLGCCHDQGYLPFLRQLDTDPLASSRITLLHNGTLSIGMERLSYKKTDRFQSLFYRPMGDTAAQQPPIRSSILSSRSPQRPNTSLRHEVLRRMPSIPLTNPERLGPVILDGSGRRVDKELVVDPTTATLFRKLNLYSWHYLREDCTNPTCRHDHAFRRPLSTIEFDALWSVTRQGICHKGKKSNCKDERCIYSHPRS